MPERKAHSLQANSSASKYVRHKHDYGNDLSDHTVAYKAGRIGKLRAQRANVFLTTLLAKGRCLMLAFSSGPPQHGSWWGGKRPISPAPPQHSTYEFDCHALHAECPPQLH